jgi:hypothetical protein
LIYKKALLEEGPLRGLVVSGKLQFTEEIRDFERG